MPFARDERALIRNLERTVARIRRLSVGLLHLKEPFALDREIKWTVGLLKRALRMHALHASETRPASHLNGGRRVGIGGVDHGGTLDRLIQQVLKVRAATLEAGRVDVREIVGDDLSAGLLCHHSRGGGAKSGIHVLTPELAGLAELGDRNPAGRINGRESFLHAGVRALDGDHINERVDGADIALLA